MDHTDTVTTTSPDTITINCTATNSEDAPNSIRFIWKKNGNELNSSISTSVVEHNATTSTGQLTVTYDVSETVNDTYLCIATNREEEDGAQVSIFVTACKCKSTILGTFKI